MEHFLSNKLYCLLSQVEFIIMWCKHIEHGNDIVLHARLVSVRDYTFSPTLIINDSIVKLLNRPQL